MKSITKLTNFELYKYIFNPIFGYKIDYPEEWNIEDILNGNFSPTPFRKDIFDNVVKELQRLEYEIRNGDNVSFNYLGYEKRNKYYEKKIKY